jgi:hypothetical protein
MAQSFPEVLEADEKTRAGRMLAAGDVRVTVTYIPTEQHITVRFKALLDNRYADGERPRPNVTKNWIRVPLKEASHVFVEVPRSGGEWPDKIGGFYPRTGRFFSDDDADPERVETAALAARWLNEGRDAASRIGKFRLQEESYCGKCGTALTDPESIDRGIGPECYKKETRSKHQTKHVRFGTLDPNEKMLVEAILAALRDLSDDAQKYVARELNMWESATKR